MGSKISYYIYSAAWTTIICRRKLSDNIVKMDPFPKHFLAYLWLGEMPSSEPFCVTNEP